MTQPSNNSQSLFKTIAAMQWLALPVIALMYAAVWQQLPSRLATHFDLANQPNGWMSREESLVIFLALATVFAITSTWICSRVTDPDPTAWGLVGLFYVVMATLIWAEHSVIAYNISGQPVNVAPVLMVGMVSAILLVVLALATRRGSQLPVGKIFAKESHSSALWAIVTGLPAILFLGAAAKARIPGLRLALGIAVAMMVAAAAMAASGFHYIFTPAGVEIRTLGFRLRSISAAEIRSYAVDRWNWLGGYGIRGVGNIRAYVWSNSGVRIHTAVGEVFLGHSDPKKIVRNLDLVMRNQQGPEATRT